MFLYKVTTAFIVCGLWISNVMAGGLADPSVLVGRWEGRVSNVRNDPSRTLIIESVDVREDRGTALGKWGNQNMLPIQIDVQLRDDAIWLEFYSSQNNSNINLRLSKDAKGLRGTLKPAGTNDSKEVTLTLKP